MWSAYSVPRMISLLKPVPPSTDTGAFMLYMTWFCPDPVRMSDSAAVEKPLVSFGMAIIVWALSQTISHVGPSLVGSQGVPPGAPPSVVWASAKPRTMNTLLPAMPPSRRGGWCAYTTHVSSPVPPSAGTARVGACVVAGGAGGRGRRGRAAARVGGGEVVSEHADGDAGHRHGPGGHLFGGERHTGRDRLGEGQDRPVQADALDRVVAG